MRIGGRRWPWLLFLLAVLPLGATLLRSGSDRKCLTKTDAPPSRTASIRKRQTNTDTPALPEGRRVKTRESEPKRPDSLAGTILDAGNLYPLAGAQVRFRTYDEGGEGHSYREMRSGAQGEFEIAISAGEVTLHVEITRSGYVPLWRSVARAAWGKAVFKIERTVAIEGWILRADGTPAGGLNVGFHGHPRSGFVQTDPTGYFEIDGLARGADVTLRASCEDGTIVEEYVKSPARVILRLQPALLLEELPRARLLPHAGLVEIMGRLLDRRTRLPISGVEARCDGISVTTDRDGRFFFSVSRAAFRHRGKDVFQAHLSFRAAGYRPLLVGILLPRENR